MTLDIDGYFPPTGGFDSGLVRLKSSLISKLFIDIEAAWIELVLSHLKDQAACFRMCEKNMIIKFIMNDCQIREWYDNKTTQYHFFHYLSYLLHGLT
ncbi:hypothetical protein AOX56_13975 [Aeromonas sobria]|uniref:Uncharacterized protein n=1 Tax=Aeromonas sobria TaxID=646 RepID=A0A2N3J114_AERSO|nr:hypothetical protein AOX56_13975 [Aeromonas sobria]